ncbi:MAG: hypothetical protein AAB284_02305, partial [Chloroflexota bacterium]
ADGVVDRDIGGEDETELDDPHEDVHEDGEEEGELDQVLAVLGGREAAELAQCRRPFWRSDATEGRVPASIAVPSRHRPAERAVMDPPPPRMDVRAVPGLPSERSFY